MVFSMNNTRAGSQGPFLSSRYIHSVLAQDVLKHRLILEPIYEMVIIGYDGAQKANLLHIMVTSMIVIPVFQFIDLFRIIVDRPQCSQLLPVRGFIKDRRCETVPI